MTQRGSSHALVSHVPAIAPRVTLLLPGDTTWMQPADWPGPVIDQFSYAKMVCQTYVRSFHTSGTTAMLE